LDDGFRASFLAFRQNFQGKNPFERNKFAAFQKRLSSETVGVVGRNPAQPTPEKSWLSKFRRRAKTFGVGRKIDFREICFFFSITARSEGHSQLHPWPPGVNFTPGMKFVP
jgi:hypothetical protein